MTASTTLPQTKMLVRGSHAWRITRYSENHFVARNNKGKFHEYSTEGDCNRFWDFLESVGFKLRQDGWTLDSLKKAEV